MRSDEENTRKPMAAARCRDWFDSSNSENTFTLVHEVFDTVWHHTVHRKIMTSQVFKKAMWIPAKDISEQSTGEHKNQPNLLCVSLPTTAVSLITLPFWVWTTWTPHTTDEIKSSPLCSNSQAWRDNLFIVRRRQGQIFDTLMMKAWMYKTLNNTYSLGDFNLLVWTCAPRSLSLWRKKDGCFGSLNPDLTTWLLKCIKRVCTDWPSGMKRGAEVLVLIWGPNSPGTRRKDWNSGGSSKSCLHLH